MTDFKKIDRDAANGEEPYDAFLLRGIARNVEAAYESRMRRGSMTWGVDDRPLLASYWTCGIFLGFWPVSLGCNEITVEAIVDVDQVEMDFGASILNAVGVVTPDLTTTESPGSATIISFTLDVTGYGGRVVPVVLLYRSHKDTSTAQTDNVSADTDQVVQLHKYQLTSAAFTLDAAKRYVLDWTTEFASATNSETMNPPDTKNVIRLDTANDVAYVWPPFDQHDPGYQTEAYTVTLTEIGRCTLYGAGVYETGTESRLALEDLLHTGYPTSVSVLNEMYRRMRQQFKTRTRIHHIGGAYDNELQDNGTTVQAFGAAEPINAPSDSWQTLGSALVGNYDDDKGEDTAGSETERSRLTVLAAVVLTHTHHTDAQRAFDIDFRVTLNSYSGGWSANTVTGSTATTRIRSINAHPIYGAEDGFLRALKLQELHEVAELASHSMRGSFPVQTLARRRGWGGLHLVRLDINDTQTTASNRLLQIQARPTTTETRDGTDYVVDVDGNSITPSQSLDWLWLPAFTVITSEYVP